mgnify:CR=1 FL=1
MLSNLLAIMAITIYNQMYGASAVLELITRYNKIATDVMQVGGFAAMVSTVKGLAVGITVLLYLIDLAGKVTEKNFSIEQFFKATLRFVVSYFFILYSDVITNYLIKAGTGITIDTVKDSGFAFFTDDPDNKTLLINGIKDMKAIETLEVYYPNSDDENTAIPFSITSEGMWDLLDLAAKDTACAAKVWDCFVNRDTEAKKWIKNVCDITGWGEVDER